MLLFDNNGRFKEKLKLSSGEYAKFLHIDNDRVYYEVNCPFCKTPMKISTWVSNAYSVLNKPEKAHPHTLRVYSSGGTPFGNCGEVCKHCGIHFSIILG